MPSLRERIFGGIVKTVRKTLGIRPSAAFMRHDASPFFSTWRPVLKDWNDDVRAAWYQATARTVDILQNSGWLAGGVQRATFSIMGSGLRLNSTPDADAIGMTALEAATLARLIESRWDAYARNPAECDASGRFTIAQLTAAALRCWFATGEIVATLPVIARPGSIAQTKVRLLPPHRLMQERNELQRGLVEGIRFDQNWMPIGYTFRLRQRLGNDLIEEIAARDDVGRPQVIHVIDPNIGQVRGLSPFVPVLKTVRQYDELSNATLMAALVHAIFAATIESSAPTADVLQAFQNPEEQGGLNGNINDYLQARTGWYEGASVNLGEHGKIAHLFMGEKLTLQRSEHPNTTYGDFSKSLLREIAACLGITYEQLSGDYSGATYSSVRMSTAEAWQVVTYRRENIAAPFLNPVYSCWLEGEIEAGRIKIPGGLDAFLAQRSAYTLCQWRGPAKPQADDQKAAGAHKVWHDLGVITDEVICADLGLEWDRVYDQLAREKVKREELGIVKPVQLGSPGPDPNAPDPNAPDPNAPEPVNAPGALVDLPDSFAETLSS